MSAIQSQLADMTKEQLIERIQKMERLCQASAKDATEQAEKVAELEASLQSTENYWKSKYEAEVDKVAELQTEVEQKDAYWNDWLNKEFGDTLYPLDPPEPDEFVEKVKGLQTEVACLQKILKASHKTDKDNLDLKRELEGFRSVCNEYLEDENSTFEELRNWCDNAGDSEYDLRALQIDLEELDTLMDDLPGVSEYGHLVDYIKQLKDKVN
jgi:uncharacterized coiled-coil DUF342 family protein